MLKRIFGKKDEKSSTKGINRTLNEAPKVEVKFEDKDIAAKETPKTKEQNEGILDPRGIDALKRRDEKEALEEGYTALQRRKSISISRSSSGSGREKKISALELKNERIKPSTSTEGNIDPNKGYEYDGFKTSNKL